MIQYLPITKARVNLGAVVRRARVNKELFILEKDGIPVAGLVDIDELEDMLEARDPKIRDHIRKSREEYEKGQSRPARAFLAELDRKPKRRRSA